MFSDPAFLDKFDSNGYPIDDPCYLFKTKMYLENSQMSVMIGSWQKYLLGIHQPSEQREGSVGNCEWHKVPKKALIF
ncbi:hypothetical protein PR048_008953 [Dryococelus australis]|uniref:Uncharacterized protein n=1 Tax=Dryococelus australis TaxID=614101 RepID=A0ABQ9HYK1_9NEOP|nr:hypothetical protein PR048_008953 [Dryococelus australis]